MEAAFDLSTATLSSSSLSVAGEFIVTDKLAYEITAGQKLHLDDSIDSPNLVDLTANAGVIASSNVVRNRRHESSGSRAGGFFQFNGTDSYIRVDGYGDINEVRDFTIQGLVEVTDTATRQVIAKQENKFEIFIESGTLRCTYTASSQETFAVIGPAIATGIHSFGVSFNAAALVFGWDGANTSRTTDSSDATLTSYSLNDSGDGQLYIGGDGSGSGSLDGKLGHIIYDSNASADFSGWVVEAYYPDDSPYAEITLEGSEDEEAGFVPYSLAVSGLGDFGYQVSFDGGTTWYLPSTEYSWTLATAGLATAQVDLATLNAHLGEYTGAVSAFHVKVFFNSEGIQKSELYSVDVNYITTATPQVSGTPTQLKAGERSILFPDFFAQDFVTSSSTETFTISIESSLGTTVLQPSTLPASEAYIDLIKTYRTEIDGTFADLSGLIGEGLKSESVTVSLATSVGTSTSSVSVKYNHVTLDVSANSGETYTPALTVLNLNTWPNPTVIDGYSTDSPSISLATGDYRFNISVSETIFYTLDKKIEEDTTISLSVADALISPADFTAPDKYIHPKVINIVQGDTPTLTFNTYDASGNSLDLTGKDVQLYINGTYGSVISIIKTCTVMSGGQISVQLSASDTATDGDFLGQVKIRENSTVSTILPNLQIQITPTLT